jgi:translation initiation factor 3 subunit D
MPSYDKMIKLTLENSNIPFFPNSQDDINNLKAFDFTVQRNIEQDEDFVSTDQKQVSAKQKKQVKQPTAPVTAKKPINQKPVSTKPKLTQTITIKPEWKSIADFNKQGLEKLRIETEPEVEDVAFCGVLYKVSEDFDKDCVNPLNPIPLQRFDNTKFFGNLSTLADEKMRNYGEVAQVFVTDKILSVIMTMVFNSRPWHLEITKVGESIFIDKKPTSEIDLVTVNESSENMPIEDNDPKNLDSFNNLAVEATLINEFIKEQILDTNNKTDFTEPHPFTEDIEDAERLAYRYRLWKLGDIDVLVRCQVHAFDYDDDQEVKYINIHALNEFEVIFF